MSEHLYEVKVPSDKPKSDMVLYRIYELVFEFEDYTFSVKGNCICNITVTPTENIVIEHGLFDANLYNAYVNNDKIVSIIEKGSYFNATNKDEEIRYETSYRNYRIKSVSGSKVQDVNWTYILEKVD